MIYSSCDESEDLHLCSQTDAFTNHIRLPKCDVNQYHIVPGKHDLKPPAPDGSCGTIAGLKVRDTTDKPVTWQKTSMIKVQHRHISRTLSTKVTN